VAGRILILVAAVVVAAVGVLVVVLYANNAEQNAQESLELTEVLVVESPIETGTTFAEASGSIVRAQRQVGDLPEDAISDPAQLEGQVALTTLYPGEIVIAARFGDPEDVTALPPPETGLAASFSLEAPQRVAGFLRAGSRVAVYATVERPVAGAGQDEPGTVLATDLLVDDLEVLAIGTSAVDEAGAPVEGDVALVTLGVTPTELEKLLFAQQTGTLHLALVGQEPLFEDSPGTTRENLFSGTP
jgi:pilus assembly protein CpaB